MSKILGDLTGDPETHEPTLPVEVTESFVSESHKQVIREIPEEEIPEESVHEFLINEESSPNRRAWANGRRSIVIAIAIVALLLGIIIGWFLHYRFGHSLHYVPASVSSKSTEKTTTNQNPLPSASSPTTASQANEPTYCGSVDVPQLVSGSEYSASQLAHDAYTDGRPDTFNALADLVKVKKLNGQEIVGLGKNRWLYAGDTLTLPCRITTRNGHVYAYDGKRLHRKMLGGAFKLHRLLNEPTPEAMPSNVVPPTPITSPAAPAVPQAAVVHQNEHAEEPLARQIALNPKQFGFTGDANNASATTKWADALARDYDCRAGFTDCAGSNRTIDFNPPDHTALVLVMDPAGNPEIDEYILGNTSFTLQRVIHLDKDNPFIGNAQN